jgi:hypothetical protein
VLYTLAASLGSPTTLWALSWPLLAPLRPLLALSWSLLHSHGPCKHFHTSATVSRPLVALSRAIQALPLPLQHFYGLYMQSHRLSCEILPTILQNIYFYCSYSSKKFLEGHERAFRGHESTFRGRDSAFRGRESTCRSN